MKFFSILLSDNEKEIRSLPDRIHRNIESMKENHPAYDFNLFGNESLREFIRDNFDDDTLRAYDELVPLAYKADLGRYCLLHVYGGIYSDISNFFFNPVCQGFPGKLYVYEDVHNALPWLVYNGLIAAPPKQRVFEVCIKKICINTKEKCYGYTSLCPTGPSLFGAALAAFDCERNIINGKSIRISDGESYPAIGFLSKTGELVAIRHKSSPGIASLGIKGGNDYAFLYSKRMVYMSEYELKSKSDSEEENSKVGRWLLKKFSEFMLTVGKRVQYVGEKLYNKTLPGS